MTPTPEDMEAAHEAVHLYATYHGTGGAPLPSLDVLRDIIAAALAKQREEYEKAQGKAPKPKVAAKK